MLAYNMYSVIQDATYCHEIVMYQNNRTNKVTTRNKKAQHIKSDVIYVFKYYCWREMRLEGESPHRVGRRICERCDTAHRKQEKNKMDTCLS